MSPSDGADTELARLLQASGRLPADQLGPLLERIRFERRTNPHASLGALLLAAGFVTRAELDSLGQRPQAKLPQPTPWRAGEQVAGYRLEEPLGRGGAGVVFRATHLATGRAVALKGLHSADPHAVERFMREAQAQAQADGHPHVVGIYDAGVADDRPYLAMELLPGGDLLDRLKRGAFGRPREAAVLVAKLARGLAHVHACGILHRDLKPENVLFDAAGEPKLVDFGVAYLASAETLTQTGQLLGTPEYMAPEQALGLTHVDVRADVYGLGAILYTCLCGRPPFVGALNDVVAQVLSDDPEPPSEFRTGLDPRLEAICLHTLAKQIGDRTPDATSLAEALEAWVARDDGPRTLTVEAESSGRKGALPLVLSALVGVAVGVGATASLHAWAARSAQPRAPVALPPSPQDPPAPPPAAAAAAPSPSPEVRASPVDSLPPSLAVGCLVMVPVESAHRDAPDWRLATITAVRGEAGRREVELFVDGDVLAAVREPPSGFKGDGLGSGALALAARSSYTRPCEVVRRHGAVALVEYDDGDRDWIPVTRLTLTGEARAPAAESAYDVVFAPYSETSTTLRPAVLFEQDVREDGKIRAYFLGEGSGWVEPAGATPLPARGDPVLVQRGSAREPAVVVEHVGPWVLRVARTPDGPRELVGIEELRLSRAR